MKSLNSLKCISLSMILAIAGACDYQAPTNAEEQLSEDGERAASITNGTLDTGHKQVVVVLCGDAFCTGTLVGDRTVVTAAHCIEGEQCLIGSDYTKEAEVILGKGLKHEAYDEDAIINDIAIIKLEETPKTIEKAPLYTQAPKIGDGLTLVGYGRTSSYTKLQPAKRVAYTKVSKVNPAQISFAGSQSTCSGDSGGPAFITLDGQDYLAGVASYVVMPCGQLGTNTRVDTYVDWIMSNASDDSIQTLQTAE